MAKHRENDDKPEFYRRLEVLCAQNGLAPSGLAEKIGLSSGAAASWNRGVIPNGETVVLMAKALNTTTDYILMGVELAAPVAPITASSTGEAPVLGLLERIRADLATEKQNFHQEKTQHQEIQKSVAETQKELTRLQKDISDTSKNTIRAAEKLVDKIEQLSLFGVEPVKGGKTQK